MLLPPTSHVIPSNALLFITAGESVVSDPTECGAHFGVSVLRARCGPRPVNLMLKNRPFFVDSVEREIPLNTAPVVDLLRERFPEALRCGQGC